MIRLESRRSALTSRQSWNAWLCWNRGAEIRGVEVRAKKMNYDFFMKWILFAYRVKQSFFVMLAPFCVDLLLVDSHPGWQNETGSKEEDSDKPIGQARRSLIFADFFSRGQSANKDANCHQDHRQIFRLCVSLSQNVHSSQQWSHQRSLKKESQCFDYWGWNLGFGLTDLKII